MSKQDSKHEDVVKRTIDAFLSTGNREGLGHTLRIAEKYGEGDAEKIKAAILHADPATQIYLDLDHSNVHIVSKTSPQVLAKSLGRAGYEVLEIF